MTTPTIPADALERIEQKYPNMSYEKSIDTATVCSGNNIVYVQQDAAKFGYQLAMQNMSAQQEKDRSENPFKVISEIALKYMPREMGALANWAAAHTPYSGVDGSMVGELQAAYKEGVDKCLDACIELIREWQPGMIGYNQINEALQAVVIEHVRRAFEAGQDDSVSCSWKYDPENVNLYIAANYPNQPPIKQPLE